MTQDRGSGFSWLRGPILGGALLVVILVVGGLWQGSLLGPGQPGGEPSRPSSERSRQPTVLLSPSSEPSSVTPTDQASASPQVAWGPLAVIPPQDGADTLRDAGTLRITDLCVYVISLESGNELLFWPADRTRWNGVSRSITFHNYDGTVVILSDGDHIVLGGSGDHEANTEGGGGISLEEWIRRVDWVSPPAASCAFVAWWYVGAVQN